MTRNIAAVTSTVLLLIGAGVAQAGQERQTPSASPTVAAAASGTAGQVQSPPDYRIGVGDVLLVTFWREPELTGEIVVRPDGKITLPLIKEVAAAGLTPVDLQKELETAAGKFIQDPNVTVAVRTINSRQVFIMGNVQRPAAYPLNGPTTVLQFLAQAGGVLEFADRSNIVILRNENGKSSSFKFNYDDISRQKNLEQNIELRPGDTVIVP